MASCPIFIPMEKQFSGKGMQEGQTLPLTPKGAPSVTGAEEISG